MRQHLWRKHGPASVGPATVGQKPVKFQAMRPHRGRVSPDPGFIDPVFAASKPVAISVVVSYYKYVFFQAERRPFSRARGSNGPNRGRRRRMLARFRRKSVLWRAPFARTGRFEPQKRGCNKNHRYIFGITTHHAAAGGTAACAPNPCYSHYLWRSPVFSLFRFSFPGGLMIASSWAIVHTPGCDSCQKS